MRLVASFLLCVLALGAGAAEIWRWVDASGVVHYSDTPRPGAVQIAVDAPAPSGNAGTPSPADGESPSASAESEESSEESARAAPRTQYTRCAVESPGNEENFFGVQDINVQLAVEPGLLAGHRIQLLVNGAPRSDWPVGATFHTLGEVYRGSYTLSVRVVDQRGTPVCSGPSITFHLRQGSVIRPGQSGA